jgi:hypothetical protein
MMELNEAKSPIGANNDGCGSKHQVDIKRLFLLNIRVNCS